jgi:hypothetical protein
MQEQDDDVDCGGDHDHDAEKSEVEELWRSWWSRLEGKEEKSEEETQDEDGDGDDVQSRVEEEL